MLLFCTLFSFAHCIQQQSELDNFNVTEPSKGQTPPSPRVSGFLFEISTDWILFTGGMDLMGNYFSDTHYFNALQGWTKNPINSERKGLQRRNFAFAYYLGSCFFWGGSGPNGVYDDLWRFSTTSHKWEEEKQSSFRPFPRDNPQSAFNSQYLYLYGGPRLFGMDSDVWRMNMETYEWEQFQTTQSTQPPPHDFSQLFATDTHLFLFGGLVD